MNTINLNELTSEKNNKNFKISTTGKIFLGITGGIAIGLTAICVPFISPALRKFCLPYVPATEKQIENIFIALQKRTGKLIDLGSGDGRIVLEGARRGFQSHGIELNPWLVLYSKVDVYWKGYNKQTQFFCKNLWKYRLDTYDNVIIFGVEQMMADLETKLTNECRNGCNIVACRFPLPNLIPTRTIGYGIDTVWLYIQNT